MNLVDKFGNLVGRFDDNGWWFVRTEDGRVIHGIGVDSYCVWQHESFMSHVMREMWNGEADNQ